MSSSPPPSEHTFGQTAVTLGFVTEAQVQECVQLQINVRELGINEPLGEIMIKKKYLTPQQSQKILRHLGVAANPIPGYAILSKIGQGGMGMVYKAKQISVNRIVALKVLSSTLTKDPTYVARFFHEAKAAARLTHKNLIAVIDAGDANGVHYFAMEFVTGRSAADLVKSVGPCDSAKLLDVAIQMAEVLSYIHPHRMIHRDIKPENILLTGDGVVKLCDFGLAKFTTGSSQSLTVTGYTVGTPYFMSPEQVRGDKDVDIRTDLYSLGATLYFLATGHPPFEGNTAAETMAMHLDDPVPDTRRFAPALGGGMGQVIQKLLAKDRADRYQTPAELLDDLLKIRSGAAPSLARRLAARVRWAPLTRLTARIRLIPVRLWMAAAAVGVAIFLMSRLIASRPAEPSPRVASAVPLPSVKSEAPPAISSGVWVKLTEVHDPWGLDRQAGALDLRRNVLWFVHPDRSKTRMCRYDIATNAWSTLDDVLPGRWEYVSPVYDPALDRIHLVDLRKGYIHFDPSALKFVQETEDGRPAGYIRLVVCDPKRKALYAVGGWTQQMYGTTYRRKLAQGEVWRATGAPAPPLDVSAYGRSTTQRGGFDVRRGLMWVFDEKGELNRYDPDANAWVQVVTKGDRPPMEAVYALDAAADTIVALSSKEAKSAPHKTFLLDLTTGVWRTDPSDRQAHFLWSALSANGYTDPRGGVLLVVANGPTTVWRFVCERSK